jgi:PadR family transcriptional regulator, regulatory protein PadR
MTRKRALSRHARLLLWRLLEARGAWKHGYELVVSTGLKSGTLYPLLIRLESEGYLEAEWQPPVVRGRPPRHAYRLTAAGERFARAEAVAPEAHAQQRRSALGEARS